MVEGFIKNYIEFVSALRILGIRVSTSEAVDAIASLKMIDILDKKQVKAALKCLLVKNNIYSNTFDEAFNVFFSSQDIKDNIIEISSLEYKENQQLLDEMQRQLTFKGQKLNIDKDLIKVYSKLDEQNKKRIRSFLIDTSGGKNVDQSFKGVVENVVSGQLSFWKSKLNEQDLVEQEIEEIKTGDEKLDALINNVQQRVLNSQEGILSQDLKHLSGESLHKAEAIMRRMAVKLATRMSRIYRNSKRIRGLDFKKTIRYNYKYGGVLFHLKYKSKKKQRPKMVLICDVSGSMARYAGFVIQFIYGLSTTIKFINSFIFSEGVEEITPFFRIHRPLDQTMEKIIAHSRIWGGGTDLGHCLEEINSRYRRMFDSNTVVVIMSDTKTINQYKAENQLSIINSKVRDIIWLNTLSPYLWENSNTVKLFKPYCKMFHCNSINHLTSIIGKQLIG